MTSQHIFLFLELCCFEELNVRLCRDINVGIQKRMVRIKYKCSISNFNSNIQFLPIKISTDKDMQIMHVGEHVTNCFFKKEKKSCF